MIIAAELGAPLRHHQRSGHRARRRPGRGAVHPGRRARCCSSTRSTGWPAPPRRCSTCAMEDFRVDVVVGKGPGRDRDPARHRAVHAGRGDHPGRAAARRRCGTGSASPPTWTSTSRPSWRCIIRRSASLLGVALARRRRRGDRAPLARHPADRQPAAAPGARLRRGPRRRRGHPGDRPGRAGAVRGGRATGLDRLDRAVLARAGAPGSAAGQSGCPPWRSRSGRKPRRSRWSPSRSWCGRA